MNSHRKFRIHVAMIAAMLATGMTCPALAEPSENSAWQFRTTGDLVNRAYLEDLRRKQASGYYSPPTYTTNIDRQYNCSISSTATGNAGNNSTVANAPSASGNTATATGNNSATTVDNSQNASSNRLADPWVTGLQSNTGSVSANVRGNVSSSVSHSEAYQVLNSNQTNSGNQTSEVSASTACSFSAAQ